MGQTEDQRNATILTLIRHGETTVNLARILQGVADSPLSVFGQAQVDALAATFGKTVSPDCKADLGLPPPNLIICSPIGRSRKMAQAIHRACAGTEVQTLSPDATAETRLATAKRFTSEKLCLLVDPGLKAEFKSRVQRIGLDWINAAVSLSAETKPSDEAESSDGAGDARNVDYLVPLPPSSDLDQ